MSEDIPFATILDYDTLPRPSGKSTEDIAVIVSLNVLLLITKGRIHQSNAEQISYKEISWFNIFQKVRARHKLKNNMAQIQQSCNFYHLARANIPKFIESNTEDQK